MVRVRRSGYSTLELCIGFISIILLLVGFLEIASWMRARGAVKVAAHEAAMAYSMAASSSYVDMPREERGKEKAMKALKAFFPLLNSFCTAEYNHLPCLEMSFLESSVGTSGQNRRNVTSTVSIVVERRIFKAFVGLAPSWSKFKASATEVQSLEEEQYSHKENFNSVHSNN